jgi:hypothetical protein
MSEVKKAVAAFAAKVSQHGLKNVRFFVMPSADRTAEVLAGDINRMDHAIATNAARRVNADEGLPPMKKVADIVASLREATSH